MFMTPMLPSAYRKGGGGRFVWKLRKLLGDYVAP